jgi:Ras family protein T1
VECSARNITYISHVFYLAQRAVLNPMRVLLNPHTQALQPLFLKALQRIFRLWELQPSSSASSSSSSSSSSTEQVDSLSDSQIDAFQVFCFGRRLQSTDIADLKLLLSKRVCLHLRRLLMRSCPDSLSRAVLHSVLASVE